MVRRLSFFCQIWVSLYYCYIKDLNQNACELEQGIVAIICVLLELLWLLCGRLDTREGLNAALALPGAVSHGHVNAFTTSRHALGFQYTFSRLCVPFFNKILSWDSLFSFPSDVNFLNF